MLRLTTLGSGSAGNSALVESGGTRLLLDAGLSAKQIRLRLEALDVALDSISGVLITHEHIDHAGALAVLCKKHDIPIYCNAMTSEVLRRDFLPNHKNWRLFETGRAFSVGSLEIESFSVPHDAVDPVGYVIRDGSGALGVLTDMGYATKMAIERVREAHTVLIETNHDEQMLQADTKRPWSVKQRILSRHGHLSNDAAGAVARELMGSGNIQRFVLGHLSRDCNSSELAIEAVARALGFNPAELPEGFEIFCASQGERSPTFSVTNSVQPKQAPTDVQTRLF